MNKNEDEVLVRELGKLVGFFAGFGVRAAARTLPTEEYETTLELRANLDTAKALATRKLQSIGKLTEEFSSTNKPDTVSAIVGSGQMNLNPTIVHVHMNEVSKDSCRISIRGLAKEGLIKQKSALKAVERIQQLLVLGDA